MSKENNLKLNGKYAIEKCDDKNYKKVAYSYSFKDTNLKYFVYVPTVAGKDEKYYIAAATKDVEEANKNGKLLKYSKKYYNDVRHHTRKVAIVTTVCVVAAGALLFSGHCAYKMVNGWKEMSASDFASYAIQLDAKQLTMQLPTSGRTSLPVSYNTPHLINADPKKPTWLELPVTNYSYDSSKAYCEIESFQFDEDGNVSDKVRYIYGAMQDPDNTEKLALFEAEYEYDSSSASPESKYRKKLDGSKTYSTYEEANKDLLAISMGTDVTLGDIIRQNTTSVQLYKANGTMDAIYNDLKSAKDTAEGKCNLSMKHYKKNKEGSLAIDIKFDVDGKIYTYDEEKSELVQVQAKGYANFSLTIENYVFNSFNVDFEFEVEGFDTVKSKKNYTSAYNNKDIYNEDWKAWKTKA